MMTAANIVQHAAGGENPKMQGGGMLSFIKYENRAISQALTALFAVALIATATDAF